MKEKKQKKELPKEKNKQIKVAVKDDPNLVRWEWRGKKEKKQGEEKKQDKKLPTEKQTQKKGCQKTKNPEKKKQEKKEKSYQAKVTYGKVAVTIN